MKDIEVQFIIVTYNPSQKRMDSLLAALSGYLVILIDNSEKHTLDITKFPHIYPFASEINFGYGGGANKGMAMAFGHGATWAIVLNQDIELTKKSARELIQKVTPCAPSVAGPFTGGIDRHRWTTNMDSARVDYISGSVMAIHKEVFSTIGGFWEPYFLYYEDADYSVRAKEAGFPLIKLHTAGITHDEKQNEKRKSLSHQYYLARNHLLFVERTAPLQIKLREFIRMPYTLFEHYKNWEKGAIAGVADYATRQFGQKKTL